MLFTATRPLQQLDCLTVELDFDAVDSLEAARSLSQVMAVLEKRMLINCENLTCVRRYGVCFCVSQLLRIHAYGVRPVLTRARSEL